MTKKNTLAQGLHENIFGHLDDLYQKGIDTENFNLALKVIELCFKAKKWMSQEGSPSLDELPEATLKALIQRLDSSHE
jgi:hypothetical protein